MTPFLALAVTIVLWASAFIAIRAAVRLFPPEQVASLRFAIPATVLVAVGAFTRSRLPERRDLPLLFGIGAVGIAAYNLALNTGARTLSAGASRFLVNTVPVFSAVLAGSSFTSGCGPG
jgi:drug/metabolite transporter (DMT)-like permease